MSFDVMSPYVLQMDSIRAGLCLRSIRFIGFCCILLCFVWLWSMQQKSETKFSTSPVSMPEQIVVPVPSI